MPHLLVATVSTCFDLQVTAPLPPGVPSEGKPWFPLIGHVGLCPCRKHWPSRALQAEQRLRDLSRDDTDVQEALLLLRQELGFGCEA